MTDQERNQVLKMIEEGRISPEEGLTLMQALDQNPAEEESKTEEPESGSIPGFVAQDEESRFEAERRVSQAKSTVQRLWQISLWIGIAITIGSALGMYGIMLEWGMNFWFYFLLLPLFLGVVVIAAAVGSRQARWIFVDVHQHSGERPQRIFFGFPLPLRLAAWLMRTFGNWIPNTGVTDVEEIARVIENGFISGEPLIVNADESGGQRVRVFIA